MSRTDAVEILAKTMWGEARGEGATGMQAVANVVMNRVYLGGWWGGEVIAVCLKPYQFSAWLPSDPNLEKMKSLKPGDNPEYDVALQLAERAIAGTLPDITNGATSYHTASISPYWKDPSKQVASIGSHLFYAGIG